MRKTNQDVANVVTAAVIRVHRHARPRRCPASGNQNWLERSATPSNAAGVDRKIWHYRALWEGVNPLFFRASP